MKPFNLLNLNCLKKIGLLSYLTFKRKAYNIIEKDHDSFLSKAFDLFIVTIILLNVTALIIETVPSYSEQFRHHFDNIEFYSIILFTIEYVLRVWVITDDIRFAHPVFGRLKYMVSFSGLIDLFAFLPFYFAITKVVDGRFLKLVRVFRVIRIFKLHRYSKSAEFIGRVLYSRRIELGIATGLLFLLLMIASSLMYFIENSAQPENFESIPASMWWGITTLTTVGYGDVVPITLLGKFVGGIIALLGIGFFALPAGIISNGFNEELRKARKNKEEKVSPPVKECPNCGKRL